MRELIEAVDELLIVMAILVGGPLASAFLWYWILRGVGC